MKKQKKNQNGITLIALVISIIVMLILAGVSLNAIVGENGILTQATSAKLAQEEAQRREELEYLLFDFNSSKFLGAENGFTDYLNELKATGKIDDYLYTDTLIVKYKDNYYETEQQGDYYAIKGRLETDLGEGGSSSDNFIVTPDNLTSGNIEITSGSRYVVLDRVSGENFNFEIPAGDPVTIKLMGDMTIDNQGYERSAIDLKEGATLNLYVYGNVTVNSGYATEASRGEGASGTPGYGGYAGIHVPNGATLNLYGTGTINAIGGNASTGKDSASGDFGGPGGGGAGAGIGGNGGNGGYGANTGANASQQQDGFAGEDCGIVNIHNSITVNAIGGAGASGGSYAGGADNSGTGGGGYPAAGIGGGGAGGGGANHINGAGGYSSGISEDMRGTGYNYPGVNGNTTIKAPFSEGGSACLSVGGSYFQVGKNCPTLAEKYSKVGGNIGGQGCGDYQGNILRLGCYVGGGGIAGKGGTIKVSENAIINAQNGNRYTDDSKTEPVNIYIQFGEPINVYIHNGCNVEGPNYAQTRYNRLCDALNLQISDWVVATGEQNYKDFCVTKAMRTIDYSATIYGQGIGSGAGYIEVSNGSYEIDNSLN